MAVSRYWGWGGGRRNKPAYQEPRVRGEQGRKDGPDVFDDVSLPEQSLRKLKGFCDVGNIVLRKERGGVQGAGKFS